MSGWHELGSGHSPSPHFPLISCVACQCQCLCRAFLEISTWLNHKLTGHDWKVISFHSYSRCCLIICDVGHVGGVVKGPQGALVGRGRANASICLHFWHNVSKYFPHHNTTEKQFCLNWFQMGQKMETLIEILMFLTLVHKGPFTPSSVLTFFNLRTLAGDKEKLF